MGGVFFLLRRMLAPLGDIEEIPGFGGQGRGFGLGLTWANAAGAGKHVNSRGGWLFIPIRERRENTATVERKRRFRTLFMFFFVGEAPVISFLGFYGWGGAESASFSYLDGMIRRADPRRRAAKHAEARGSNQGPSPKGGGCMLSARPNNWKRR